MAKGWTVVRMIMILDVDVTAERRHYNTHRPLKGKRLTTFCASLALLHPLLSLTHWIFRSLMLPYKSSSHSAKCVRCASLRSGGRRLAVRTAMDHPIGALPCTPFCLFEAFPLKGKREIWREKQGVIYFRYRFGVFPLWWLAPPPCTVGSMSYDTESKSVTLALYSSPDRAIPQPSARRAVKLTNPPAVRPVHLKNLSLHNLSTQPAAVRRP